MQGPAASSPDLSRHSLPDIAVDVLAKFDAMHASLREAYAGYRFHEVAGLLYDFFWGDYCDWFVEAAKPILQSTDPSGKEAILATMDAVLSGFLRLLHPLMPHLTEELWSRLGYVGEPSGSGSGQRKGFLLYTRPPSESHLAGLSPQSVTAVHGRTQALYSAVHTVRNLRAEFKIPSNQQVRFMISPREGFTPVQSAIFAALAKASAVELITGPAPAGTPGVLTDLGTVSMPLEGLIDVGAERLRVSAEMAKVEAELAKVNAKLSDPSFVEKVPSKVLEDHRQRRHNWHEKLEALRNTLNTLG
jgi:valyl-tRNA synthetase